MAGIFNDVKVSLRQLLKTPGFTASAILVLALGIGLNAAMFGLSHSMVFAARPFDRPEQIVQIYAHAPATADSYRAFSYGAWRALDGRKDLFEGVLAQRVFSAGLQEEGPGGVPRRTASALVSGNYFETLGVRLARGRAFTEAESTPGAEAPVAIASYSLWKRAGLEPDFLGRTIRVNGRPFTIVGITPKGFTGTNVLIGPEIFLPFGVFDSVDTQVERSTPRTLVQADRFVLTLMGRLKPGLTAESASPGLTLAAQEVARTFPDQYRGYEFLARPAPRMVSSTAPPAEGALMTLALAMLGMTGSVLMIVCLNLASLFLARGQARRREFAIRLAIGGGRGHIVRQFVVEGLILSLTGGALGAALGVFALDAVSNAVLDRFPLSFAIDLGAPPAIALGTAAFSVLATLMFALGPALRHSRDGVLEALKQQAGDDAPRRSSRFMPRNPLVAAQVALSLSLLISAGLFIQMARQANLSNLGFDASPTVSIEVDAGIAGYSEAQALPLYAAIEDRLRALPEVQSSSVAANIPFHTIGEGRVVHPANAPAGDQGLGARWNAVGASYFDTIDLKVSRGRAFTEAEGRNATGRRVAIINDSLARRLFPDGEPLGRSIEFEATSRAVASGPIEVIGVVGATREDPFDKGDTNAVYVPFAQGYRPAAFFHVRARGPRPEALVETVQREVAAAAPGLPAFKAVTFERHVASSFEFWALRLTSGLFISLGLFASLIAIVGIYGSLSYAVSRRTREIGVRLAIGASPNRVRRMVIEEGLALGGAGVLVGLLIGLGVGRVMAALFVDVAAFDLATFTLTPLLLLTACAAAAAVPARRATAVNPVTALRAE